MAGPTSHWRLARPPSMLPLMPYCMMRLVEPTGLERSPPSWMSKGASTACPGPSWSRQFVSMAFRVSFWRAPLPCVGRRADWR
eukprot:7596478-Pyramimonas_sp.AAC.1